VEHLVLIVISKSNLRVNLEFLTEKMDQVAISLRKSKLHEVLNDLLTGVPLVPQVKPMKFIKLGPCSLMTYKHPLVIKILDSFETIFKGNSIEGLLDMN